MMAKTRKKIEKFIHTYETFDENEIANNLPDVSIKDIREFVNEDFERINREVKYK